MRVIAFASQKGGSGKTTLSGHVAVAADLAGHGPVAIVDTDPQGSLSAWWNDRPQPTPHYLRTTLEQLPDHLAQLEKAGVKLVVVDTPPAITTSIRIVIELADHVVVPTRPGPHDLRAVGATVALIEDCNKPMVFVINDATARAKVTAQAAVALSQHGTVAPVTVHHRTDFATSMIDGGTVMEHKASGKSSSEINALWTYLEARIYEQRWQTVIRRDDSGVALPSKQAISLTPVAVPDVHVAPVAVEPQFDPEFDPDFTSDFGLETSPKVAAFKAIEEATRNHEPSPAPNPRPNTEPNTGPVFGRRSS